MSLLRSHPWVLVVVVLSAAVLCGLAAPAPLASFTDRTSGGSSPGAAHSSEAPPSSSATIGGDAPSTGATIVPPSIPRPQPAHEWSGRGCTAAGCHAGIEPIREPTTGMFQALIERGVKAGDSDGCTVCHGGNVAATTTESAHEGSSPILKKLGGPDAFFPDPASPWVNEESCGQCHAEHVRVQWKSLMMTEAGKIQGTTWAFGALEGYEHGWANYASENPKDPHARLGTDAYRAYMATKKAAHPNVFVDAQTVMPEAPKSDSDLLDLENNPGKAAFTYIRAECQRCHLGVKGRQQRGDFRGMGCGACHVPYSNEGLYEGADRSTPSEEPGHMLVHRIQGTRNAKVQVGQTTYSGIPVETCTTCHNRGKRIGVSYQGLMEAAWDSPYTEGGGGQIGLHSKHYIALSKDVHYQRGMLCQDCHSSGDVHGDGFHVGTNLGAVEIECSDCHGTPKRYPWELPLGFGDENGRRSDGSGPDTPNSFARGTGSEVLDHTRQGKVWPREDGYLLTARGNPMPEVVRRGDQVVVHTAGGRDLTLSPLKRKLSRDELSLEARVAMVNVEKHVDTMECYSCHSSWAPQCYGCHVKVDYSSGKERLDWIAAGQRHHQNEFRTDRSEEGYPTKIPGEITEKRSYLRWEDPPMGLNGEGRVSPIIPGCQVSVTVIGKDGKELARNKLFRTLPHSEGSGPEGQIGSDMSPVQPHTVGKARSCESCHSSRKALGYGSDVIRPWSAGLTVDLTTADGAIIPARARTQIEPIAGLLDWSAVVDVDDKQLQTVGHHFKGSGPLTASQRANMDRRSVCVGCHQEIPDNDLAVSLLHHVAQAGGMLPRSASEHTQLVHKVSLTAAWAQVLTAVGVVASVLAVLGFFLRRRLRRLLRVLSGTFWKRRSPARSD